MRFNRDPWDWGGFRLCSLGGSQPSGNTTTTQTSQPWAGEQAPLEQIYGAATDLYGSNTPQYYPGDTYANLTGQQEGLMSNLIGQTSAGGTPALQASDADLTNTLSPGFTSQTSGTFGSVNNFLGGELSNGFTGAANGTFGTANSTLGNDVGSGFTAPQNSTFGSANGVLGNELSSSFLDPANSPEYSTAISNALAQAVPSATASFVNGNRSDSGLASAAASSAAANAAGGLAQQQYNTNLGIQNQATGQAASDLASQEGLQGQAIGQGSSNLMSELGLQNQGASLGSTNLLGQQQIQNQASLYAPMTDQESLANATTGLNVAGMDQTNQQNQINANVAAYNYGQMLPWNQLGLFESAVTGTGSPGGTSSTTQPFFTNPVANIAGAASGLGSLGLGLGALFGLSDRRAKTDIERIGESDSGFPLYVFRYKGEAPMSRHIGLMADDVELERPDAVFRTPSGLMMVDYGRALAA